MIYLISADQKADTLKKKELSTSDFNNLNLAPKNNPVNQIKNIAQEKKIKPEIKAEIEDGKEFIHSFEKLLEICIKKKEIKLKYELEKNVSLVSFEKNRIEISFNNNLDKSFVKDLSSKLF